MGTPEQSREEPHMRIGLAGACVLAMTGMGAGDVVVLEPVKDNTLFESAGAPLSNGIGDHMFCGMTAQASRRRAVLAFDIAGSVPPGSTVNSVSLRLSMSMTIALDTQVTVHRLNADWGEGMSLAIGGQGSGAAAMPGDATWVHRFFDTLFWATPGGDFAGAPSASATVGGVGLYTWTGPGLVQDVQQWVSAPASNFGWLVRGTKGR